MSWRDECANTVESSKADACSAGHAHHTRLRVPINLDERPVPDCPACPGVRFEFEVFDPFSYCFPGYCTGDDELSRSIAAHGSWEPWETALAWQLLREPGSGVVLDIGCHVGWYSILAGLSGRECFGVAADAEQIETARLNVALNGLSDRVTVARGWIDGHSHSFPLGRRQVRLAKLDIEGSEAHAVRMLGPALADRRVDYLLVETGPEFGEQVTARTLHAFGYRPHLVPDKGYPLATFELDPLAATLAREVTVEQVVQFAAQATILWTAR